MKVKISAKALISFVLVVVLSGCGYTAHLKMPDGMQSIYVPNFENAISASERYTYVSGLEIDITNAVIDRILYDGNLKLVDKDFADMILQGKVVRYEQEAVRYNSIEGVQQYRLFVVVSIELVKRESGEVIWEEGNFTGDAEYFIEGSNAVSERTACDNAINDLAKNIVDRIVEDW